MSVHVPIVGRCPMGCGATLFVGPGGYITCGLHACPNPAAASDILADRETVDIVTVADTTFTVRHPLRERLDDALDTCDAHRCMDRILDLVDVAVGRYRMHPTSDPAAPYRLERIES